MSASRQRARVGADIGGTFTDIALEIGSKIVSTKVLTNYAAPEQAILDGISIVTEEAGITFADIEMVIHGTTLATNALIERRGVRTAFVTTEGFRDVIETRTENRFEQYDLRIRLPEPLIARPDRFTVRGRIDAQGKELVSLDEDGLRATAERIRETGYASIAVGFIHAYVDGAHERRARAILAESLPDVPISISSEVSPQMREFERFNTVVANAYVAPLIANYLRRFQTRLEEHGAECPIFMIHSGGGLMTVETAIEFPVRLVESGPAGGALFAATIAASYGLEKVVSYDMGGTTAKICLIEDQAPKTARTFEVARTYRFKKGSGMPIAIPVIEMIEIGAGGGSLASVDALGRIQTGPESAGSEPGPACYGRGGERPTITDADLLLGKVDPEEFAGGSIQLSLSASERACNNHISERLGLETHVAAFGVSEVVDENMANAARVHAVESGKDIAQSTMIAFGGAAPLHAARLCEKLGINRCLVPLGAGVGSAIGFLKAPFAYEGLASKILRLESIDVSTINTMLLELRAGAEAFVRLGTAANVESEYTAFMRYVGQGWEIPVELPAAPLTAADLAGLRSRFENRYEEFFGRKIDALAGLDIEVVTWSVRAHSPVGPVERFPLDLLGLQERPAVGLRSVFDAAKGRSVETPIFRRGDLGSGDRISGPAIIVERETSTVVSSSFEAIVQRCGAILMLRKGITA